MDQLLRLAAHLQYWRKALVMTYITRHSTFTVRVCVLRCVYACVCSVLGGGGGGMLTCGGLQIAPQAPLAPTHPIAVQFQSIFPKKSFPQAMASFSEPRRLKAHVQGLSSSNLRNFILMVVRGAYRVLHRHACSELTVGMVARPGVAAAQAVLGAIAHVRVHRDAWLRRAGWER